jgi:hypothetical protein
MFAGVLIPVDRPYAPAPLSRQGARKARASQAPSVAEAPTPPATHLPGGSIVKNGMGNRSRPAGPSDFKVAARLRLR